MISGDLSVGDVFEGVGTVTVYDSGQVTNATDLSLDGQSSAGTVQVDGPGSAWTNSGNVYVGGDTNGAVGTWRVSANRWRNVSAAAVIVWSTGMITGDGIVRTTEMTNHGTLAPDPTISIKGDLAFDPTATMSSIVTPDIADNVVAQGMAGLERKLKYNTYWRPFYFRYSIYSIIGEWRAQWHHIFECLNKCSSRRDRATTGVSTQWILCLNQSVRMALPHLRPLKLLLSPDSDTNAHAYTTKSSFAEVASNAQIQTDSTAPRNARAAASSPRPTPVPRPTLPPHLTPPPTPSSPRPTPPPRP